MDLYNIFEDLGNDLIKYFNQILLRLYNDSSDFPIIKIHVSVKDENNTQKHIHYYNNNINYIMYFTNPQNNSIFNSEDEYYSIEYYNYFYIKFFDFKYENYIIKIAFEIEKKHGYSLVIYIASTFINYLFSTFIKYLNSNNKSIYEYDVFNRYGLSDDNIISQAINKYFLYHYNLNTDFISLLSSQKYESESLYGKIIKSHRGYKRKKKRLFV